MTRSSTSERIGDHIRTIHSNTDSVFPARAGSNRYAADGYILKTTRSSDLVNAIESVAQGRGALDPAAAQVLMRQTRGGDPLLSLTQREREVFDQLARGLNVPEITELLSMPNFYRILRRFIGIKWGRLLDKTRNIQSTFYGDVSRNYVKKSHNWDDCSSPVALTRRHMISCGLNGRRRSRM